MDRPLKRGSRWSAWMILGLAVPLFGLWFQRVQSTFVEGKPIEEWVKEASQSKTSAAKAEAVLLQAGSEHLDDILEVGLRHRNGVRGNLLRIYQGLKGAFNFPKSDPFGTALARIGPPAIPFLRSSLTNDSEAIRVSATNALNGLLLLHQSEASSTSSPRLP